METPTEFGYNAFRFNWGDHICAIFDARAQQMDVMGHFVSAGIRAEQRCVWIGPEKSAAALREALQDLGGDLPTLEASSQLLIISEIDFYLQSGVFEPDRTRDLLQALLQDNQREGYYSMRIANDVSWLREDRIDALAWEEFEATLTHEISSLPMVMVCQYDRHQVSGDMIVIALQTHPAVILGDRFRQNPFFAPTPIGPTDTREII
ncbi:MAG: MEDS domain-containing protein [Armatimonadota bacterium]|nr:MEDS domain-containing protein [Armatimonadota bacterium]